MCSHFPPSHIKDPLQGILFPFQHPTYTILGINLKDEVSVLGELAGGVAGAVAWPEKAK